MKIHATFALLVLFGCLAWTMANVQYKGYPKNALKRHIGRKPYVSPEQLPSSKYYARQKREISQPIVEFQNLLLNTKKACMKELGVKPTANDVHLLYKENPTKKEKCVIACLLKRTGIMDSNNLASPKNVANIVDKLFQNNALLRSIALASAENCNRSLTSTDKCEAGHHISRCIANALQAHKVKLVY